MRVGICTLGCKVNTYESEYIVETLEKAGYAIAPFDSVCDVYIINTCTVTNTSDAKSRKMIHQAKRRNPKACLVAMGCFVEANGNYRDEAIDIYIGNKNKSAIVSLLDEYFTKKEEIHVPFGPKEKFEDMFLTHFEGRCRAFLKIQDGCENFCNYCIIPYVRGKCRSKELKMALKEARKLVENGYQELVLTGIHTGHYGVDLETSFADLLKEMVQIKGLKRLRISSVEATEMTGEVLEVLRDSKIIANHLHIPLQAGSDPVLKAMGRKYDLKEYEEIIKKIREIRPDISITTDIIVGFPGETEEMFLETCAYAKKIFFAKIHVFPYSERKGTKAVEFPNQVDPLTKKDRARRLTAVSRELELAYAQKFQGKTLEVLIETSKDGISTGHTSNYLKVKVKEEIKPNTFVKVEIKECFNSYCMGVVKEEEACLL